MARKKPARETRTVQVLVLPGSGWPCGLLRITTRRKDATYLFREIPCPGGRGFLLREAVPETETYAVSLTPRRRTCDCKGFNFRDHCKHCDALAVLVAKGKL